MKRKIIIYITFIFIFMCLSKNTFITEAASDLDLKNNGTYEICKTQSRTYNELYKNYSGENKTFNIKIPTGTLYMRINDENTKYKVVIFNSKGEEVNTFKSVETSISVGNIITLIDLKADTYKIKIVSTTEKKLNGHFSFWVISNKGRDFGTLPDEVNETIMEDTGVTKNKEYNFTFKASKKGTYVFNVSTSYDSDGNWLGDNPTFEIIDSNGNLISTKNSDEWIGSQNVVLEKGAYTLKTKVNKNCELSIMITKIEDELKAGELRIIDSPFGGEVDTLNFAIGDVTTYTHTFTLPKGTMYFRMWDTTTAYKVEIINSKNKIVKTLNSKEEKKKHSGEKNYRNSIETGIHLSKGKYKIKISSTSDKNLYGQMQICMLNDESMTIKSAPENFLAVTKGKTYNLKFYIEISANYEICAYLSPYDINRKDYCTAKAACKLFDSSGNVISSQKVGSKKDWVVYMKKGYYTFQIETSKSGLFNEWLMWR